MLPLIPVAAHSIFDKNGSDYYVDLSILAYHIGKRNPRQFAIIMESDAYEVFNRDTSQSEDDYVVFTGRQGSTVVARVD